MNNTFILLARSILDSEVFANERTLKIWVWCLCKANHKKAFVRLKIGKGLTTVEVQRGQFIFGRNKAADELCMEPSSVYRDLQKMQEKGMIKIKPNNQYSIVTICKYDDYQDAGNYECTPNEQPKNKQRTTNEQQVNTYKNDNNEKNEKNNIKAIDTEDAKDDIDIPDSKKPKPKKTSFRGKVKLLDDEYTTLLEKHGKEKTDWMLDKLHNYKDATGKTYKSDYGAINMWVVSAAEKEYKSQHKLPYNEGTIQKGHMAGMTAL